MYSNIFLLNKANVVCLYLKDKEIEAEALFFALTFQQIKLVFLLVNIDMKFMWP